jgi:hypothetical protein
MHKSKLVCEQESKFQRKERKHDGVIEKFVKINMERAGKYDRSAKSRVATDDWRPAEFQDDPLLEETPSSIDVPAEPRFINAPE